ncbi:hypothetical protein DPMN_066758 [Dreissena polymorpha]|uniref:Uncharacterized protein n=1 Tax=Dreissena polymorpha TaxID=45954 RepID=A0A9D4BKT9_DREPO|nr:hypothetical protein DPMN_066758 [Dreissena polymorpha]
MPPYFLPQGPFPFPAFPVPPYIGNHSASLHGMRLPLSSPTISGGENSSPKLDEDTPSSTAT